MHDDENPYRGPNSSDFGALPARAPKRRSPIFFRVLLVVGIVGVLIALLLPVRRGAPEAARRNACASKLKQIGIALQNYVNAHGALPPAYTTDADGKPLHSWRTLILPYVEEVPLYKTIDLTKPWDDPANAEAFETGVDEYRCPSSAIEQENLTTYLAIVTPTSCLRAGEPRKLSEVTDGHERTLVVIEVDDDHAVPWMSPVDADEQLILALTEKSKLSHTYGMQAVFVDGRVQFLGAELSANQRRALISIAGGERVSTDDFE
jgi:type II secretory pathway pseudopilin PulG